jgi:hypothetical protein
LFCFTRKSCATARKTPYATGSTKHRKTFNCATDRHVKLIHKLGNCSQSDVSTTQSSFSRRVRRTVDKKAQALQKPCSSEVINARSNQVVAEVVTSRSISTYGWRHRAVEYQGSNYKGTLQTCASDHCPNHRWSFIAILLEPQFHSQLYRQLPCSCGVVCSWQTSGRTKPSATRT